MAATTTLLGLVTPTQGSLPGVWGDTVNYGITEYLDIAIAGTLTLTGDGTVILANTTGSSSGTNITSTLSGAGTVTAQFAIVKVSGTTGVKIVQAPSFSRTYLVVNASSFAVTFKPSSASGVSIAAGETASVYYNGTDYVKVVGTATAGAAGGSTTQVQYNNAGVLAGITGATTNGTALTLVAPNLGSPFSVGTMPAFTLGGTVSGGGNQINNVVIGTSTPLAGAFTTLTASSTATLNTLVSSGATLTGGTINGMTVGATTAAAGAFTTLSNTGQFLNLTGAAKTVNAGSNVRLFQTNEASNYAALQGSFVGAATAANRVFRFQTIEQGVANDGIISFQPDGGTLSLAAGGGATTIGGGLAVTGTLSATGTLSGGTSGTAYSFSGSAPATSLTLDSSGNLGVGRAPTAAGTYKMLELDGSAGGYMRLYASGTLSGYFYSNATESGIGSRTSAPFVFYTNDTERMRLDSSGNLGIGTTSPAAKLHIGVASAAVDGTKGVRITNPAGTIVVLECGSTGDSFVGTTSGSDFNIRTSNSVAATFSNVGIVTMPAYGAGAATFSAAGVISSVSDETWKVKDGVPTNPDTMLNKLAPGYWYYNDEKKETFGSDRQLGFYAQNVNDAIGPEAAPTPEEGKPWGYYDRSVLAITVMSLQKALATIETLTARITALETP